MLVMVVTAVPTLGCSLKAEAAGTVGGHYLYGSYPKTKVNKETELYAALEKETKNWKEYGYLKNKSENEAMQYADFWYEGNKYRAVRYINRYKGEGTTYSAEADYYQFVSLYWTLLDPDTGLMICTNVIDSQPYEEEVYEAYNNKGNLQYSYRTDRVTLANTYPGSYIDDWLNNDFYNTAFTENQKDNIVTANLEYDVYDETATNNTKTVQCKRNVYLPKYEDVTNSTYGFSDNASRQVTATDYAKSQGVKTSDSSGHTKTTLLVTEYRQTDSNSYKKGKFDYIQESGKIVRPSTSSSVYLNAASNGIRPMIRLKKVTHDRTISCQTHKPSSSWTMVTPKTCTTNGLRIKKCTVCGATCSRAIIRAGHVAVTDKAVAATCTETGLTEGKHCRICKKVLTAQNTVEAKGHTYETTITKATTSENGSVVTKCVTCGAVKSNVSIDKISTVKLSKATLEYTGKAKKPTVTVNDSKGKALKEGTDYTVKYSDGCKNVGKYTATVTFKGNYSDTKKLTFTIIPEGTSISKLTAGKKQFTVKWKKQSTQTTGYEIQYSTSKNMKSAKTATISKTKTTSTTVKSLKASKTYYVRIRTYKTVKGTKIYSSWSGVKNVKVKK